MKYRLSPNAEIATAADDGEELRMSFDKDGVYEVPDDFQEATRVLDGLGLAKVKEK